jgi:hypothetical protein
VKLLLAGAAMAVLAVTPAWAHNLKAWIEQSVGQQVFSLGDTPVGRIDRYIDVRGTPGAIITGSKEFGGRTMIVPAEDLGPRDKSGLLLNLTDRSIATLQPYQPGRLPFW